MNKKYLGSDFDDFLAEHGMLATVKSIAILCVFAYQISILMEKKELQ